MASMNKNCSICGKGSMLLTPRNKLRGKYNPAPKKRKYPNLQWVTLSISDGKRIKACTRCIKTLAKPKK